MLRGGYHKMINDLMAASARKVLPWLLTPATSTPLLAPHNLVSAGGHPLQPPHVPVPMIHDSSSDPPYDYLDCKEEEQEILFEYEGWTIEHYKGSPKSDCDWISHYCPSYGWRYRTDQWTLMADGICAGCCKTIPEEVLGVWKLKNFDNLVSMEQARVIQTPQLYATSSQAVDSDVESAYFWARAV